MKILFVTADILLSEPLGIMQLSAICKQKGYETKLISLKKIRILKVLETYKPDIVAYSTMTPDEDLFIKADRSVKKYIKIKNKHIIRIMGGPHATYFPEILNKCVLDAICIGEGDNALPRIIENSRDRKNLSNIPNVVAGKYDPALNIKKELVGDLDSLPFADRSILYDAVPYYKSAGLRSILVSRGCPYECAYCYNHAYNNAFSGCGKILRRRSVDNVIEEIKYIMQNHAPVRMLRFADDTFAHQVDQWLENFVKKYKKEVGLPFYCLMRSNTLTEGMAKLLSKAGCISIGMSVETGDENVRINILKRKLSDEVISKSFSVARKHRLNTYGNTMLGIPGTTLKQDFDSFIFTKKLKLSVPTFGIFCPYPGTKLTEYAMQKGMLDSKTSFKSKFGLKSVLNYYTDEEKEIQLRLSYLAPLFCSLPDRFIPFLKYLVKKKLTKLYFLIDGFYSIIKLRIHIFPYSNPRTPIDFFKILKDSIGYTAPSQNNTLET